MSATSNPITPDACRELMVEQAETARHRFHTLLGSLDVADLSRPSMVSRWTVQGVLAHMVSVRGHSSSPYHMRCCLRGTNPGR
jgi:hypothetical protein